MGNRVTQRGEVTCGGATRRHFRRELQSACWKLGVDLKLKEDKGWLDSQFLIKLTGDEPDVDRITAWVRSRLSRGAALEGKPYREEK